MGGKTAAKKVTLSRQSSPLDERLHRAVKEDDAERARLLIAQRADVNGRDRFWGRTPLHFAAEQGRHELAGLLIAHGADVNARDAQGMTPLHLAAHNGRTKIVESLITDGADVNARGDLGHTPLHEAIAGEHLQAALELVEAQHPELGHNDDLYWELEEKFEPQIMIEIVKILLTSGADANVKDDLDGTALSDALMMSAPLEVIKMLLAHGADPGMKDDDGVTILHEAVSHYNDLEVVALFLDHGTNVNVRDKYRQTPLHEAAWLGDREMVELLIARGATVNAKDRNGDTPAHVAAFNGYVQLLSLLASKGADMRARNNEALTPLDYERLAPPPKMIMLSPEGSSPYAVTITRLPAIRWFLRVRGIDFDRIWIPEAEDIRRAETVLKLDLRDTRPGRIRGRFAREYILTNLDRYNREYGGFVKGRAKYVVCNMSLNEFNSAPLDNRFTGAWDGGCSLVWVLIALDAGRVIRTECN